MDRQRRRRRHHRIVHMQDCCSTRIRTGVLLYRRVRNRYLSPLGCSKPVIMVIVSAFMCMNLSIRDTYKHQGKQHEYHRAAPDGALNVVAKSMVGCLTHGHSMPEILFLLQVLFPEPLHLDSFHGIGKVRQPRVCKGVGGARARWSAGSQPLAWYQGWMPSPAKIDARTLPAQTSTPPESCLPTLRVCWRSMFPMLFVGECAYSARTVNGINGHAGGARVTLTFSAVHVAEAQQRLYDGLTVNRRSIN